MVATACRGDELSWGDEGELPPGGAATFDGATHSRNSWALPFNCAVRANVPRSYAMTNGAYPWEDSENAQDREYCLGADANGDGRISFREASDFAASNDVYAVKGKETPQFAESTPGLGDSFFTLKDVEQIPVGDIAAMATEGKKDVTVEGCVPGFYYTLYGAQGLSALPMGGALPTTEATAYGPVLCEPDKPVTFEAVEKPSETAGFFSIGASPSSTFMP